VAAAGGAVVGQDLAPLRYNSKACLLNPHFLAIGDPSAHWEQYLETPE